MPTTAVGIKDRDHAPSRSWSDASRSSAAAVPQETSTPAIRSACRCSAVPAKAAKRATGTATAMPRAVPVAPLFNASVRWARQYLISPAGSDFGACAGSLGALVGVQDDLADADGVRG